jgi:phosphopentomutase
MDATLQAMDEAEDGDLVFTNFVDFDMLYGHRRDVPGYAAALEAFDAAPARSPPAS